MQATVLAELAKRVVASLLAALLTLGAAAIARAADSNIEKQAQALQQKAIEEDSLNLNYPEAIKKLAVAISRCGADHCSAALKGALYRDLGAMLILNGQTDDGRAAYSKALALDPSLELDLAYKTPALEAVWNDVKKKAGVGAPTAAPETPGKEPSSPSEGAAPVQPTGDFAHVPAVAQRVRTPLPIYVDYAGTEKILRVVVKYRGAGASDWKSLDLRRWQGGYGGLIPCQDVTAGRMQYYIQGYGPSGDAVVASGTRTTPYTVPILAELSGPAPSLPGQEPPAQCAQTMGRSDCPPDFPGCHAGRKAAGEECERNPECASDSCESGKCIEKKGAGDNCESDDECASGSCSESKCTAVKREEGEGCDSDDQCTSGTCKEGTCERGESKSSAGKPRRIWVGIAGSLDITAFAASENVCALNMAGTAPENTAGYQCVDPTTGANFPGAGAAGRQANMQIVTGSANVGDAVRWGLAPANLRLMLSFDYALSMNVLLGARAGYVFFTDPASSPGPAFTPVHLEARATFLLGRNALNSAIAPMLLVGAGAGEFDAAIGVQVQIRGTTQPKNENAWIVGGPMFAGVGAGLRVLLAPSVAATAAIKGQAAFGGPAGFLPGIAPELGLELGF